MKTLVLSILLILSISYSYAQSKLSVPEVDAKTYQQYLNKDWNELLKTGKKALKNGIDFYYLQYRMGIAYYEQKKYVQSVKCLEKVYSDTPDDETIQEYLYFAYLLTNRIDDARLLSAHFSRKLINKLSIETEQPFIKAVYFATKHDINEDYQYVPEASEVIKQKTIINQSWYNLSFEHMIGEKVTIFHGYSHMTVNSNIVDDDSELPSSYLEKLTQNEYYFSLKYHLAKGLNLSGGFHYLHSYYYAQDDDVIQTWGRRQIPVILYDYSENDFAGSLKLDKSFSIFNTGIETSVSNLNNKFQIQPSLSLRIYPFGNSVFFSETKAMYLIENDYTTVSYNPVFKQSLGFKFLKYSFFNPSVTFGDLINYTNYNAFIANNDIDKTTFRIESYLNIGLAKGRFNIFLNYQYNQKENNFEINGTEEKTDYINQTITGGIKWYFRKY